MTSTKNASDAPCTQSWKLWRHCCCRYGWYSLLVTPIITAGCLLSIYSSLGCDFVQLEVGFTPSNEAWNQSTANLGLFTLYTGNDDGAIPYADQILDGCEWYPSDFAFNFIEGDRTWKVARIMALISGAASMTATLTSWLFLFTPLPASFFWPGLLLPAVLVAFLAEGSKFLMFDTAACRTALWTPAGVDSLGQKAESCSLGSTAVHTIISGCIFFVALMFVCLKAPKKRLLDETYGRSYDDDDNDDDNMHHHHSQQQQQPSHHNSHLNNILDNHHQGGVDLETALSGVDYASQGSYPRGSDVYIVEEATSHTDHSQHDFESASVRSARSGKSGRSGRSGRSRGSGGRRRSSQRPTYELKTVHSESSSAISGGSSYHGQGSSGGGGREGGSRDGRETKSAQRYPQDTRDDVSAEANAGNPNNEQLDYGNPSFDRMTAAEIAIRRSEQQIISESRVSKIEKMEESSTAEPDDMIAKFVSDLNESFQRDEQKRALDMPPSLLSSNNKTDEETSC